MRNSTFLLAAIALSGCAAGTPSSYPATTEARLAVFAQATPCCDDPSGFQYRALPPRGILEAEVGKASPVFDFHSGKSPFVAFELPKQSTPYRVRIKSEFEGKKGDVDGV